MPSYYGNYYNNSIVGSQYNDVIWSYSSNSSNGDLLAILQDVSGSNFILNWDTVFL